jgi:hypothetical protein
VQRQCTYFLICNWSWLPHLGNTIDCCLVHYCQLLNNNWIHLTGKDDFGKTDIFLFVLLVHIPLYFWWYHPCHFIYRDHLINCWNLVRVVRLVLEKIPILFFGAHLKSLCFWSKTVYIHQAPTYDKLLNTEHEQNISKCYDARKTQIHPSRHRWHSKNNFFFCIWRGSKPFQRQDLENSSFSHHNIFSYTWHIWETKKRCYQ